MNKKRIVCGLVGVGLVSNVSASDPDFPTEIISDFSNQEKNIEHNLESITQELLGDKQNIELPEYRGASYGDLENNDTPINIERVQVSYQSPPPEELKNFVDEQMAPYTGKIVPLKELVAGVQTLEEEIVRFGYPMVRVVLPAQELSEEESIVKVEIISGYLDNIDVEVDPLGLREVSEANNTAITNLLVQQLSVLQTKPYLTSAMIDRQLLLVKEKFGIYSELFLRKGQRMGAFDIVVRTRFRDYQQMVTVNNGLSKDFGSQMAQYVYIANTVNDDSAKRWRISSSLSARQKNDKYYRSVGIDHSVIDVKGHEVAYKVRFSNSASVTKDNYKLKSTSRMVGVNYTVPYILKFKEQVKLTAGLSVDENRMFNTDTSAYQYIDKVALASIGAIYKGKDGEQRQNFDVTLAKGIKGMGTKTQTKDKIFSSQAGVENAMNILTANYVYQRPISFGRDYQLEIAGQYTNDSPVLSSQKFSATGTTYRVRSKDISISGDEGFAISHRFNLTEFQGGGDSMFIPYISFAYGEARRAEPSKQEAREGSAHSYTVGIRGYFGDISSNLAYSVTRQRDLVHKKTSTLYMSARKSF